MYKESFLEMAKRHKERDILVQGEWDMCSVGCFNRDYGNALDDFEALSLSTGYPEWVHRVQEAVFESLTEDDAINWHVQFAQKMETVKDFEAFYHSIMVSVLEPVLPYDKYGVAQTVIDLHKDYKNVTSEDWDVFSDAAARAEMAGASFWGDVAMDVARFAMSSASVTNIIDMVFTMGAVFWMDWEEVRDVFLNANGGE